MASISPTTRPGYVYDSATDTWIPIGIGPHTHASTDLSGVIANSIVDAKADLITATADNTPARLAVGNNGETLVADSSASTGLRWAADWNTGKNKIINGDFGIWQRGTSFSHTTNTTIYTADRFSFYGDGSSVTRTISRQTFTPGTAPVAGYEGQYFLRFNQSVAGSGGSENSLIQPIEDVRTLAGQTVTVSFWAKADATRTVGVTPVQRFGSGGSSQVVVTNQSTSITTSWARYSFTFSIPSVSGKTIGTSSALFIYFVLPINTTQTIDFWGVQVEAGSVATPFTTATGTLAGELAACQRYYQRYESSASYAPFGTGYVFSTTQTIHSLPFQVRLRGNPSVSFSAGNTFAAYTATGTVTAATGIGTDRVGTNSLMFALTAATGVAAGQGCFCVTNAGAAAYIEVSSEL